MNFEAEAKSLRPRSKGSEAKAEARAYEAETVVETEASRLQHLC